MSRIDFLERLLIVGESVKSVALHSGDEDEGYVLAVVSAV